GPAKRYSESAPLRYWRSRDCDLQHKGCKYPAVGTNQLRGRKARSGVARCEIAFKGEIGGSEIPPPRIGFLPCQRCEITKSLPAVFAECSQNGALIGKMILHCVEPDRPTCQKPLRAGSIGVAEHAMELYRGSPS